MPSKLTLSPCRAAAFGVRLKLSNSARAWESAASFKHRRRAPLHADAAKRDASPGQPLIGIVGAQRKAIFGARGEHAVGLAHALHHQIVDHDAQYKRRRG